MEQSSISTNVTIDFNKKPEAVKKPVTRRAPSSAPSAPKKLEQVQAPATFTPKQGEIPVKI